MSTNNALILTQVILQLLAEGQRLTGVLMKAHQDGRDVSDAELDELSLVYDNANAAVQAEIAKQREPNLA